MHLKIYEFDMKLKYPFSISRHTYFSQPTVIIELIHEDFSGYGEATLNPYYDITIENLKDCFTKMNKRLGDYSFESPDKLYKDFMEFLDMNSFALAALNNASWDLFGKMKKTPVSNIIDLQKKDEPPSSYTLGIDTKDGLLMKMADLPWPIYKIKAGTDNDLDLIKYVRANTDAILRVDANCAWELDKTLWLAKELRKLGIEFIEQPLPAGHPDQEICFEKSVLPLIADESCRKEADVDRCLNRFHGINIKLLKCGGLTPAIKMVKRARELGLKIMVGCMTESSVGISAASQLIPFVDYVDLDGPLLLAEDVADGVHYEFGKIRLSGKIGVGINCLTK
ncbi:MAG: dipeptide epimerase [Cytophagales bacterium]|nr:dipeptide epimerase [Cytophagales bacterium]